MAAELLTDASRALDANANPFPGAKWYFYATGTLTPQSVYTTAALNVAHANPVVADAGGKFPPIYFDASLRYRGILENESGTTTIYDIDPINTGVMAQLSGSGGSSVIGFIQDGDGAEARTVQDKARDVVNVRDFYQATDPDWTNAFERAIYTYGDTLDAVEVFIPAGEYILSRQIIPRRTVTLRGAGMTTTILRFTNVASLNATLKGAFSFGLETTLTAYTTNPGSYPVRANDITAGGADQSQIFDLSIFIEGTRPANFDYGIWNSARLTARNVMLYGCGVKTIAGALIIGSGTVTGNANGSVYDNVRSLFATEHGFVTDGADCNAIGFKHCEVYVPTLIGFYEGSQFGNSYESCRREGVVATTTHGFRSVNPGGSNGSVFIGCYNEGDTVLTNRWDIASGSGIIFPFGAAVDVIAGRNTLLSPGNLAGLFTRGQFNWTASGAPFDLGSALIAASRGSPTGFQVRAGDGSIGALERGGDGTYLTKDGTAVMKVEKGAAIADLTTTATSGSLPTPNGSVTIANAATPTVVELLEYCAELEAKVEAILARLRAGTPNIAT